jgi:HK97 family phage portal protein
MRNPLRALFELRQDFAPEVVRLLTMGNRSVSGQSVTEQSAMRVAAVYSCVSLIAGTLATLPLHIYQRRGERERQRRDDHPVAIVFRSPNPNQTRVDFLQQMQAALLLRGNAYAWIQWEPGQRGNIPRALWPLHPDLVDVTQGRDMSLRYEIRRRPEDQPTVVPSEDIFHVRGLSSNGYKGRSVLEDARDVVGIAQATQESAGTFWANGGGPDVVLKHPKVLSDKAKDNIESHWLATYGGNSSQRRAAVIEEGMDVMPLSLTKRDAQFLETRQFQRGEICGMFQVPPHMIGDTEKSTSWGTGIEQQQIGFLQYTLRRWLVTWEQAIWQQFIEAEGSYYAEFNVDGLLRGDMKTRMDSYAVGIANGVILPNEARARENLPAVEGGDVAWRMANLSPLTQTEAPAPALVAPALDDDEEDDAPDEPGDAEVDA